MEDFWHICLKAWSQLAMNEFAWFAYRGALIRPAEKEIKPAQNVATNPFKCGRGSLRCLNISKEKKQQQLY